MSDRDRIDDMLMKGIDKVESKLDKIVDKIDALEISAAKDKAEHKTHENVSELMSSSLHNHIKRDDEVQEQIDDKLQVLSETLHDNTESLKEHMRRTDQNENMITKLADLHEANQHRILQLEEPRLVFSTLKKWLIGAAAIAAAGITIIKFFNLI